MDEKLPFLRADGSNSSSELSEDAVDGLNEMMRRQQLARRKCASPWWKVHVMAIVVYSALFVLLIWHQLGRVSLSNKPSFYCRIEDMNESAFKRY